MSEQDNNEFDKAETENESKTDISRDDGQNDNGDAGRNEQQVTPDDNASLQDNQDSVSSPKMETPPEKPDYSYNWSGKEQKRSNRKKSARRIALVATVCILIVISLVAVTLIGEHASAIFGNSSNGDTSESSSAVSQNESTAQHASVPDVISADTEPTSFSNTLTDIYGKASRSICTVHVTYLKTSGYAIGSGFVINAEEGYIATNYHVIESANEIVVKFYDGTEYDAELVGSDATSDLAVLKVDSDKLVQIPLGSSDNVEVGEFVVAIGTPYSEELAGTMTYGILSGIARDIEITNSTGKVVKTMTLLQTDCSINPGNSGGPLIDMSGKVIGITSLKIVDEEFEGIGFAIPITSAIKIFNQIIAGEDVDSDFTTASAKLGITVYRLEEGLQEYRINPKCDYPAGVLTVTIEPDSAVYSAGLAMFDIITEFNGESIESLEDLTEEIAKYKAGEEVTMKVFRFNRSFTGGDEVTLRFKLDAAT